ncbi:MAG: 4Fe-4S binding protein [Fidelibacterota bacterium]
MKTIRKTTLRRTVQLVFLGLFILTVLQAGYPFQPWIPPELFLWADPLTALATQIAGRFFDPLFLIALIVLLSPLVFSRAFCGWICPLGTTIDLSDRFIAKKRNIATRKYRSVKSFLLILILLFAVLGWQIAWYLDPLPILWRSLGIFGISFFYLVSNGILNGLYDLDLFTDTILNLQDSISIRFFPLGSPTFTNLFLPFLIFITILALGKISRRFWCRNLCPLGALLGLLAKFSPLQRIVAEKSCTACSVCQKKCKMDAIEEDYIHTEKSECILCLDCQADCPADAIRYGFQSPLAMQSAPDFSRRSFIGAGVAALLGTGLLSLNGLNPRRTDRRLRPPGALPEDDFIERCVRCGECVRICATSGACLQMAFLETGLAGLLTPVSQYRLGYCEYNCNLCGQICPTKAIRPLELEEKQNIKVGTAFFLTDRCIPYRLNENCIVCEEHCPLPDKAIKLTEKEYADPGTGSIRLVAYPWVDSDLCIGCGICENKCPLEGEAGIVVTREGEERF